jgi:hypothetical protein
MELVIDAQGEEPFFVVSVAAKIDELAARAAQHELPATTFAISGFLIHHDIQGVRSVTV